MNILTIKILFLNSHGISLKQGFVIHLKAENFNSWFSEFSKCRNWHLSISVKNKYRKTINHFIKFSIFTNNKIDIKVKKNIQGSKSHISWEKSRTLLYKKKKEEKVRDFRDTLYTVTGRSYILQLNIYMIHVYIIILTCGRSERNMKRSNASTHAHTGRSTSAIFFDAREKDKSFRYRCRVKSTSILHFSEHETGLSREMGSSFVSLLEKSDLIVRSAIVFAFCNDTFQLSIRHGYEKSSEFLHIHVFTQLK